jgi:sigma-E factor negative regulatory protein RseC
MEEIGIVKSIDGPVAKVVLSRRNSCCDSCEKVSCDIPEEGIETEAINQAGARVGQRVKVVMRPYTFIKGALILYVFPILALFIGAFLGKVHLSRIFEKTDSELLAAIGAIIAFLASLLIVKLLSGRMSKKTEYRSVIESIVEG